MKKIFDSKDEKIVEKAFLQNLITSVLSILLCIVALCSTTYAWFGDETMSNNNTIISGSFSLDVSVAQTDGNSATANEIEVTELTGKKGVWVCKLPTAGKYTVTLTLSSESTVKGHCIVKFDNKEKNTDAIIGATTANKDGYKENSPFIFTIKTTENNTVVEFKPVWGIVADPDIIAGGEYSANKWEGSTENSMQELSQTPYS